MNYAKMKA